jgi:hypothetical protein
MANMKSIVSVLLLGIASCLAQTNKPYWLRDKPQFTLDATVVSVTPDMIVLTNFVPVPHYSDPVLDPHGAGAYREIQPARFLGYVMEQKTYRLKWYPEASEVHKGDTIQCADCYVWSDGDPKMLYYWKAQIAAAPQRAWGSAANDASPVKIDGFGWKVIDKDDLYWTFSWKLTLRSVVRGTIPVNVHLEFLDVSGFPLENDFAMENISDGPGQEVTGICRVKTALAEKVAKVRAKLR